MTSEEIRKVRQASKDLTQSMRDIASALVDENVPKAERFLLWLQFDNLMVMANNNVQKFLDDMEEES